MEKEQIELIEEKIKELKLYMEEYFSDDEITRHSDNISYIFSAIIPSLKLIELINKNK